MMKKLFTLLSALFLTTTLMAQVRINGHEPFYDQSTQSLMFVTDSASLNDLTANVVATPDSAWKGLKIDGNSITNGIFHFGDASNDKTFSLTAYVNGVQVERTVRFTCLPVIKITKGSIFTDDYEDASLFIDAPDSSFFNSELTCKIKHRGGTTNAPYRHKRNYKFKVTNAKGKSQDVSFFGMRNDNGWILDAGQVDLFRMRNRICHKLWLDFSTKPYYFSEEPEAVNGCNTRGIELFVNNEYRGMYTLMEPVDRKQLKLKKYKDDNGVQGLLYKTESNQNTSFWDLPDSAYSNSSATWTGWEAKYPEPGDDADTTDYAPLNDFINFTVSSTDADFKDDIANRLDLPLFRDYTLFVQFIGGFDNLAKNIYWSVYNKTKKKYNKFVITPWDMDATFGQFYHDGLYEGEDSSWVSPTKSYSPLNAIDFRLQNTLGTEYANEKEARYAELRKTWFSYESLTNRFKEAFDASKYSGAINREEAKWSGDTDLEGHELNFASQLEYIENWIALRLQYLDGVYHYTDPTGINSINAENNMKPSNGNIYNLQGQKVSSSYHGIVIQDGRKFYQK